MYSYNYNIDLFNIDRLTHEINSSNVTIALDNITSIGSSIDIYFKAELSESEILILDDIISNHSGEPLVEDILYKVDINNVEKTAIEGGLKVSQTKLEGSSSILVSHDFCDPTTWWNNSERVVQETLSTSDSLNYFSSNENVNWIDLVSGKVPYEDRISGEYLVKVYVDDVEVTTGFAIDYSLGKITFSSNQGESVVKVDYSYENGSTWVIKPSTGKILKLLGTRVRSAVNLDMTDGRHMEFQLYVGGQAYGSPTVYKNLKDFIKCAMGDIHICPKFGQLANDIITFDFNYVTSKDLKSAYAMEIHIKISNDVPISGEWSTIIGEIVSVDQ